MAEEVKTLEEVIRGMNDEFFKQLLESDPEKPAENLQDWLSNNNELANLIGPEQPTGSCAPNKSTLKKSKKSQKRAEEAKTLDEAIRGKDDQFLQQLLGSNLDKPSEILPDWLSGNTELASLLSPDERGSAIGGPSKPRRQRKKSQKASASGSTAELSNNSPPAQLPCGPTPIGQDKDGRDLSLTCHICQKVLSSAKWLDNHLKKHGPSDYFPCPGCSKLYKTKGRLSKHQEKCPDAAQKQPKNCVCGKTFPDEQTFIRHIGNNHIDP